MMERIKPNEPQQSKLLGYFHLQQFNLCPDNDGTAQLRHQKSKLLGYFHFQQFNLYLG
jgi:hypothetical protein